MNTTGLMKIRIGSRPSKLAIAQVKEIMKQLPKVSYVIVPIETDGDRDKKTPLTKMEKTNFFTHDIERALIEGKVDVAIHSAKDLEETPPAELVIAALTLSIASLECLVSKDNVTLGNLAPGAVVGTSSRKRKESVKRFRSDLVVKDIRGDIDQRINQLNKGLFDAIIVAQAALLRLGYEEKISEIISEDIIKPHPLQGRLAIQLRKDRADLIEIFRKLNAK